MSRFATLVSYIFFAPGLLETASLMSGSQATAPSTFPGRTALPARCHLSCGTALLKISLRCSVPRPDVFRPFHRRKCEGV